MSDILIRDVPVEVVAALEANPRFCFRSVFLTRPGIGFSARAGAQLRAAAPRSAIPVEYLTPAAEDRAWEVQALLADRGLHRAPSVPDLLIAAIAEQAGLVVLHLDKGFELIAEVIGQPTERLALA